MADVGVIIDEIENNSAIKEDDLELSLSLRPSNNGYQSPKINVPETSSPASNGQILSKRDSQALRRHEVKLKRDSKRRNSASFSKNDVVADQKEGSLERRGKAPNLGFQRAPPPWLGWNAGGFVPYQGQNGNYGSHIEGNDVAISSGSSSGISDNYQSIVGPGGNNSDAGSHSCHPDLQISQPNAATTSTTPQLLQPCCSSQLEDLEPNSCNSSPLKPHLCNSNSMPELVSSSSHSSKSLEGATSLNTKIVEAQSNNNTKPLSNNITPQSSSPKLAKSGDIGKPPKPVGQKAQRKPVYSNMPCVLATGNGPKGKTITGFLYKYIEEVSIVCVCHGASFSPAGFVEHAGGIDIEYPLRHIKVVPFSNS